MLTLAALVGACGPSPETAGGASNAIVPIRVAEAVSTSVEETFAVAGTIRLRREIMLGFTSPGRIARIAVDDGQRVAKGQLLAELDTTTVGADLASAAAERQRAAAELQRSRELYAKGWVTRARLDSAEAAYRSAGAAAEAAGFAARTARIVAPSSGIVLRRIGEVNQVVSASEPVVVFGDDTEGFVLQVPLTDTQAATVSRSGIATVAVAALDGAPMPANVIEIAGRADDRTGTFMAELALPRHAGLRSGQIGSATFAGRSMTAEGAVTVPAAALFAARAGEAFVFVLDARTNRVTPRKVVPGTAGDRGVIVLAGLSAGERVAVTGLGALRRGARVLPTMSSGLAPPA